MLNGVRSIVAIVLILTCVTTTRSDTGSDDFIIRGTIRDDQGAPVSSAFVSVFAGKLSLLPVSGQRSDVTGAYSFTLEPGESSYQLRVEARSYDTATMDVAVRERATLVVQDVTLKQTRGGYLRSPYVAVPIFFATDRQPISSAGSPVIQFGNDISGDGTAATIMVSYGQLMVDVPQDFEIEGNAMKAFFRKLFRFDVSDLPVVEESSVTRLSRQMFVDALDTRLRAFNQGDALLFIHGYDTSFADAACTAAELSYVLGNAHGPTILYSWSSHQRKDLYLADKRNNDLTRATLHTFLLDVAKSPKVHRINIVAHSMGNQALTDVLLDIANESQGRRAKIGEVILAAPDVDALYLQENAEIIASVADDVTLYASNKDWALGASFAAWHAYRAGNAKPPIIAPPIKTIDATLAHTDLLGHGYFLSDLEITHDIDGVLAGEKLPRAHVTAVKTPYLWRYAP